MSDDLEEGTTVEGRSDEVNEISNDNNDMINKIKSIPVDKLKQIITDQIDLEIRLKHKELTLTEEEIGKCESQMITLRNYFQIPREKSISSEPNDFTIKYYDLLNRSLSVNYDSNEFKEMMNNSNRDSFSSNGTTSRHPSFSVNNSFSSVNSGHSYRTRSTTSSLRPPTTTGGKNSTIGCLYRRTDGIIVKLTCPDCKRSNFSSAQGFLNHSRIAHTQEYTSQDAAALICGELLPDNEQDEEGLASIKNLKSKDLDPSKNLNINEIYFNGLSNSLNTVHKPIEKSLSPLEKETESELMKKFIKSGLGSNKQDYDKYLEDFKRKEFDEHDNERVDIKEIEEKEEKKRKRSESPDHPPLKIKIKLRNEDKRKKKK